jgi:hypothetical protein
MRGNRADAFNEAQTFGVGEYDLGYEHCTCEVHPTLTFSRLANAQERVGWWGKCLFLAVALRPSTKHTIRVLRKNKLGGYRMNEGDVTSEASAIFSFWQRSHVQDSTEPGSTMPQAPKIYVYQRTEMTR